MKLTITPWALDTARPEPIPLITEPTRLPNSRLWDLHRKSVHQVATQAELDELDRLCAALEAEQDNEPISKGAAEGQ